MKKEEKALVMIMKVAATRVLVVVIVAVTVEISRMIAIVIVKATIVKTIVAMIGLNTLVIERMKM